MASPLKSSSPRDSEFPKDFEEGPRAFLGGPKHPVDTAQSLEEEANVVALQSGVDVVKDGMYNGTGNALGSKLSIAEEPHAVGLLWADRVAAASAKDTRKQPWKEAFGGTLDQGADGEDLINLQLPNYVQCGSLAA